MNMTIDMGNTNTKVVLFENDMLRLRKVYRNIRLSDVRTLVQQYEVKKAILSSVRKVPVSLLNYLKKSTRFIQLKNSTPVPVRNRYKTPHTLGKDRLASVIGAAKLFPGQNVLVVDTGTCIKYDLVTDRKEYKGGSISPGLNMRYTALHQYTDGLPLLEPEPVEDMIGRSTKEAIQTGVQLGILSEIEGFIKLYKIRYKPLRVVITGGDALRFASQLKLPIFAASDLVNIGLHEILKYNASS